MTLDLGALVGEVSLDATLFETTYVRVVRKMAELGARADAASVGTSTLDRSLAQASASANAAAAGLGRADRALTGAGVSASDAAAATTALNTAQARSVDVTTEAGLASSKLTQAQLRQTAAALRLAEMEASGTATTRQLVGAQASLVAANDRVALSTERVARAQIFGAQTSNKLRDAWASIPGPVKIAVAALAAVTAVSIDAAKKFQDVTTRIGTQANASREQVDALRAGILHMAAAVATAPDVLALAAYHIASVGQTSMTTAQELAVLKTAAEGAKLGHANLTDVTNALDAAIVANMKGVRDYTQVMGVMNATVGAGDMSMQDFADAFGPLGSTFKGFGVTIQQAGAALATFGDNNLRGSDAGTQLRMSITALSNPLKAGKDQLQAWGITSGSLASQLAHGGLTEALTVLAGKLRDNGVTADEMGPKLAEMFGKRGPQQGLSILINQLERYDSKLKEVTTGGNTFAARWTDYTKTLSYAWDRIRSGADAAAISLGNKLLPDATLALGWLGTTGVSKLEAFGHALTTNTMLTGGLHDVGAAIGHVVDALRNAGVAVEPLTHALLTVGAGAALSAFRVLATTLNDVAIAVDDVTGFFAHNRAAAETLAAVLVVALAPAALAAGRAFAWTALEAASAGLLKLMGLASTATGTLRGLGLAGVAAKAGLVLLAVEAFNAIGDLTNLDSAAGKLRHELSTPLKGNIFRDLQQASTTATASLSGNAIKAMGAWQAFSTGFMHPVHAFALLTGSSDSAVAHMQGQIGAALGNVHDLTAALYGLGSSPIDAQQKISAVISAMGLSVKDLATKDFPGLLSQVNDWIAANQQAQAPAARAHQLIVAMGSGALDAAGDVQALTNALDLMAGDAISADEGAIAFRRDIAALDVALKKSGGSLSLTSTKGQDAREAFDQAAQQALNLAEAEVKLKGGNDKARTSLEASIRALKAHAGGSAYAKDALGLLEDALAQLPASADHAAAGLAASVPKFRQAGADAAQGYADGITAREAAAITAAAKMGLISYQAAKNAIRSSSPSKLFAELGTTAPEGYAQGIATGTPKAVAAAKKMATAAHKVIIPPMTTLGTELAAALGSGFGGYQGQLSKIFTGTTLSALDNVANRVHTAIGRYQTDMASSAQMKTSIAQGLLGAADISGLALSNTGGGAIRSSNATLITQLARESKDVDRLRRLHLDPTYLQQIASAPPAQGVALAEDILAGHEGSIAGLNRQQRQLQALAGSIGGTVSNATYASVLQRDRADVEKMVHALVTLVNKKLDLSASAERAMERAFATALRKEAPGISIKDIDRALGLAAHHAG